MHPRITLTSEEREHQVERVFSFADIDRSGDISWKEWEHAFGDRLEGHDLKHLFREMDKNGDGYVSWQEFKDGLQSIPTADVLLVLEDLDDRTQKLHAASCKHL